MPHLLAIDVTQLTSPFYIMIHVLTMISHYTYVCSEGQISLFTAVPSQQKPTNRCR